MKRWIYINLSNEHDTMGVFGRHQCIGRKSDHLFWHSECYELCLRLKCLMPLVDSSSLPLVFQPCCENFQTVPARVCISCFSLKGITININGPENQKMIQNCPTWLTALHKLITCYFHIYNLSISQLHVCFLQNLNCGTLL